MEFGTCVHWLLEQVYRRFPKAPSAADIKDLVKEYELLWKKLNPNPWSTQLKQQEKVYGFAEAVLPAYFVKWGGDFAGGKSVGVRHIIRPERWDELENQFAIPYKYPDGKTTVVRGKRDAGFLARKARWLLETKTKSRIDEEGIQDTLPTDLQVMLYLWAMAEESGWKSVPAGVLYNIIRTPGQRILKNEPLHVFLQRVAKEVNNPKKFDHYFIRFELNVTKAELQDWKTNVLDPMMLDVRAWVEGTAPHYPNPDALITKYGRSDMFELVTKGSSTTVFRRKHAFNELSDLSL